MAFLLIAHLKGNQVQEDSIPESTEGERDERVLLCLLGGTFRYLHCFCYSLVFEEDNSHFFISKFPWLFTSVNPFHNLNDAY